MSWTPDFFIKKEDYTKIEHFLKDMKIEVFTFNIAEIEGVVFGSPSVSSLNRKIDMELNRLNIKHWLLNGEGINCDLCITWGNNLE